MIPTKTHLNTLGVDAVLTSRPIWEPFGRKPWRLVFLTEDGDEFLRREPCRISPAGLPYEFADPAAAFAFKDACLKKMGVNLETSK